MSIRFRTELNKPNKPEPALFRTSVSTFIGFGLLSEMNPVILCQKPRAELFLETKPPRASVQTDLNHNSRINARTPFILKFSLGLISMKNYGIFDSTFLEL